MEIIIYPVKNINCIPLRDVNIHFQWGIVDTDKKIFQVII